MYRVDTELFAKTMRALESPNISARITTSCTHKSYWNRMYLLTLEKRKVQTVGDGPTKKTTVGGRAVSGDVLPFRDASRSKIKTANDAEIDCLRPRPFRKLPSQ